MLGAFFCVPGKRRGERKLPASGVFLERQGVKKVSLESAGEKKLLKFVRELICISKAVSSTVP